MIFVDFATLVLTTHDSLRVHIHLRGSQEDQAAGGGRGDRFRGPTHTPSGPGCSGNCFGNCHFWLKINPSLVSMDQLSRLVLHSTCMERVIYGRGDIRNH